MEQPHRKAHHYLGVALYAGVAHEENESKEH